MKRRASSYLLVFLCVILAGLMSYTVYATLTASLAFSNTISFEASDEVYYSVKCSVKYDEATEYIVSNATIDHDGQNLPDPESTDLIFTENDFRFTKDNNAIVYEITITNYSIFDITATLELPEFAVLEDETQIVKNELTGTAVRTIEGFDDTSGPNNIDYKSTKFYIKSTCLDFTRSFENVSNDFGFSLVNGNNLT